MSYAYIGSFNYNGAEGINICSFERETGKLCLIDTVGAGINAGNLCVSGDVLYATDEQMGDPGRFPVAGGGRIFAFRIDKENGKLTQISKVYTNAINPSHVTIDESGKYMIVTHFSIGPVATRVVKDDDGKYRSELVGCDNITSLYRLNEDGSIGDLCDVHYHNDGEGPLSMIHKAYQCPGKNLFAENDLGADRVYTFRIDYEKEKLEYFGSTQVCFDQEGPRHGAFHPSLPYLYINYERKGAVTRIDVSDPSCLKVVDECEFVSDADLDRGKDAQSELMSSCDGRLLYSFMRGKGLALVFDVAEDGSLSLKQKLQLSITDPRGADFTPDKKYIIIAGHDAGKTITLAVAGDGTLSEKDESCEMPHPACTAFYIA